MHLNGVIEAAGWWSYAVVFVLTASQTSAFIGLLVPGETAILLAAAVAGRGELNAFLLTAVVAAGAVTGDGLGYALGRRCARRFGRPRTPGAATGHRTARARAFLAHHGGGDGRDVALVDGCEAGAREHAPDGVPRTDLRRPLEGVGGERVGPQEGPGETAVADLPFGSGVQGVDGVGVVDALVDDAAGEQDDMADSLGAGRLQQGDGARLGVEEEARRPGELGRGVLRPEPHHLGLLRE
jgi:hypothetical protein